MTGNAMYIPVVVSHRAGGDEVVSLAMGLGATACACSGAGGKQPPEVRSIPLLDVAEVVALEHRIESEGTSLLSLMQRAGMSLARFTKDAFPPGSRVLVLCGSGNNGGDGWVAARDLVGAGYAVTVLALRAPVDTTVEPAHSAAMVAMDDLHECDASAFRSVCCSGIRDNDEICCVSFAAYGNADSPFAFEECDVIVDCLLGAGFDGGEVREPCRRLIERANKTRAFRIACDVPSGMNAQTGDVRDVCFHANATVTMIAVKTGLASRAAKPYVGRLLLAPLDIEIG